MFSIHASLCLLEARKNAKAAHFRWEMRCFCVFERVYYFSCSNMQSSISATASTFTSSAVLDISSS